MSQVTDESHLTLKELFRYFFRFWKAIKNETLKLKDLIQMSERLAKKESFVFHVSQ